MIERPPILIVDHDQEALETLVKALEREFEVKIATSSKQALDYARTIRFSAIVYEYSMTDMTGDLFFERIRNITVAARVLMGYNIDNTSLILALNNGGISFFISKPLEISNFVPIIRKAVARSSMRRKLRHEQILLQGLLDNLPYGLAFKDEHERFVRINQLAAARRGLTIEACLGKTEEEIEPPFKHAEIRRLNNRLQREKRFVETVEIASDTDNGQSQWFVITRFLLGKAKGSPLRPSVLMELDITQQKNIEAQLQQSEKLQALGTMAGGIAHDFNNLLTAIIGSLEMSCFMIEKNPEHINRELSKIKQLLDNALTAAQKGSSLTERLLSFSRKRKLSLQKTDIYQLLLSEQELLIQTIRMRQSSRSIGDLHKGRRGPIRLDLVCPSQTLCVHTDPAQLELVIMNLCINAADAMPDGGNISLTVYQEDVELQPSRHNQLIPGPYVVIEVKDEGVGMTPETLSRIFEPFFTTKEVGWGTGLGLAMVYGFVQQSKGDIQVISQPGEGTTFRIYLPAISEDKTEEIYSHSLQNQQQQHILIVDDEEPVRTVITDYLNSLGHIVIQKAHQEDIIPCLENSLNIKLVIIDLSLVKVRREEFINNLQKRYPNIKLLFIAGYVDPAEMDTKILILNKPFTLSVLAQYINRLLT